MFFKLNVCRMMSDQSCKGMEDPRLLNCRAKAVSAPRLPMVVGRVEVNLLLAKYNSTKLVSDHTCVGMEELKLLT